MTRRYRVVINGFAGTCDREVDLEERIRSALGDGRDAEVSVVRYARPEEAAAAALAARREDWDAVVSVGGDGTHHWLLDGLAEGDVPLGLVPLGTANDLAEEYGISPDLEEACRVIRRGARTRVDLIEAQGKAFATAGGMGLATDIALGVCRARQRSRLFRWFMQLVGGWIYTLYMVATVLLARRLVYHYTVETEDGGVRDVPGYMAIVMNQAAFGKTFQACPEASNRDGHLDLLLIKQHPWRFPRLRLLSTLVRTMSGAHVGRPDTEIVRARRFRIRAPAAVPFFADGEFLAEDTEFEFGVRPRALPLLVPAARAESIRLPARPLASSSGSGLHAA